MEWIKLSNLEYFDTEDPKTNRVYVGHEQDWYRHWFKRLAGCGPTTAANILLYNTLAGSLFGELVKPDIHTPEQCPPLQPYATFDELVKPDIPASGQCTTFQPYASPDKPVIDDSTFEALPVSQVNSSVEAFPVGQGNSGLEVFPVGQSESLQRMELMWRHVTPSKRGGVNSTEKFCKGIRSFSRSQGYDIVINALDIPADKELRPSPAAVTDFISEALAQNRAVAFLNLDNGSEKQLEKWHWVTIVGIAPEQMRLEILDNCEIFQLNLNSWLNTTTKGGGFVKFFFID
jgi:hypothetical protein